MSLILKNKIQLISFAHVFFCSDMFLALKHWPMKVSSRKFPFIPRLKIYFHLYPTVKYVLRWMSVSHSADWLPFGRYADISSRLHRFSILVSPLVVKKWGFANEIYLSKSKSSDFTSIFIIIFLQLKLKVDLENKSTVFYINHFSFLYFLLNEIK